MWRVNRNQGTEKKIDCLSEELHYEKEAQEWMQEATDKVFFSCTEIPACMKHMYQRKYLYISWISTRLFIF